MAHHLRSEERLGQALRGYYDGIAKEPLPERWVDLINYLNDKERANKEAPSAPTRPPLSN